MCGLCGVVGFGDLSLVERAAETMAHRGPDDSGAVFYPDTEVGLGFRRLAILDLSPAGHQPFVSEDERTALVFNGEIYNFKELRAGLEARGVAFRSGSDTEVILRLFQEQGISCIRELNGMFSIAILDRANGRLFLARDRLGIKPLYLARRGDKLAFASEIKAILETGLVEREIDHQAMWDYFTYLYVPCPATIYEGIRQVPPATVIEIDLETLSQTEYTYWDVLDDMPPASSDAEERATLRSLLEDSVQRQMISDVPLGLFLSGGIDSSILAGLAAGSGSGRVKTFTVVFQGEGTSYYDESELARLVAGRFDTEHTEIPVSLGDPMAMLEPARSFDQPFGNPTFFLMQLISKAAREHVTVALCGAGGDELFAGYPRYRAARIAERMHFLPSSLVRASALVLAPIPDRYRSMRLRRAREFIEGWNRDPVSRFVNWTYFMDEERKRSLLPGLRRDDLATSDRVVRTALDERIPDPGNRMLWGDVRTFLLDNLLEYTDKMSMSTGLEVRVPYLDHRVVGLAMRIPFDRKLRGSRTKLALRSAAADLLPPEVLVGAKKGFNVPLAQWMKGPLDSYFRESMTETYVREQGIFDPQVIDALRNAHRSGRRDNSHELFSIIVYDAWYRREVLGQDPLG